MQQMGGVQVTAHGVPLDGSVFMARYKGEPVRRGGVAFAKGRRYLCVFKGYRSGVGWMRFEFAPSTVHARTSATACTTYQSIWSFLREWEVIG